MAEKLATKETVLDAVSQMTTLELADLVKALEEKFGVQAAPAVAFAPHAAGAAASGGADPAAAAEEKTEFTAVLTAAGGNKIPVIKVIREITALGLKEAKDLVEGAPKTVKEGLTKEQAEEIKKKLTEVGATVEIK